MRQNERDATVIWLWNKLESNMSPLTPKVHSQGSLSKFTLKVLGNTEGSKLSDSVDILSRFTLKVLGNTEGSKLSDSVDMYTYDVTDQLKHYCSPSGPSQSPTHTHTRSIFFLERTANASAYSICCCQFLAWNRVDIQASTPCLFSSPSGSSI